MAHIMEILEDFEVDSNLKFKKGEIKSFSDGFLEKFGDKLKVPEKEKPKKEK